MHLSLTTDREKIKSILLDSRIKRLCVPEDEDAVDLFNQVIGGKGYIYLLAMDGESVDGVFMLHPTYGDGVGIHVCMLPSGYGSKSKQYGVMCIDWVKANTAYTHMLALIPSFNRLAVQYVKSFGFREQSLIHEHWLYDGRFWDSKVYMKEVA